MNICSIHVLKSVATHTSMGQNVKACRRTCAVWAQLFCFSSFMFYIPHLGLENIHLENNLSTTLCNSSVNSCDWRIVVTEAGPLSGGGRNRGFEWQYKEWQRYADRYSETVSRRRHSEQSILSCYQGNRAQRHWGKCGCQAVPVCVFCCHGNKIKAAQVIGCLRNYAFIYLSFCICFGTGWWRWF